MRVGVKVRLMSIQSGTQTDTHLVEAARIAVKMGGAPLGTTADVLATACVAAATLHPEWAAAYTNQISPDIGALAEAIVRSSPVAVRAETA